MPDVRCLMFDVRGRGRCAARPRPGARGVAGRTLHRAPARQRGAAAVLAMMFLVIFASLATAMAIVSEGNLRTADSHLKMNRALATADAGMRFMVFRLNQIIRESTTDDFVVSEGIVDDDIAAEVWERISEQLVLAMATDQHNLQSPTLISGGLHVGPIAAAPGAPVFSATFIQHPIPASLPEDHPLHGHSYDSSFYDRPPYDGSRPETDITWDVSETNPLDARWIRLRVEAIDGPRDGATHTPLPRAVVRSISMDFRIDKKIRAAVLSKSRVMIGANVMIEGRIGSNFMEVNLENGHPVQMVSDFRGIDDALDEKLDLLVRDSSSNVDLTTLDVNGDNRLSLSAEVPAHLREAMSDLDYDGDGHLDDWDIFFDHFDSDRDGRISVMEMEAAGAQSIRAQQLIELIATFNSDETRDYITLEDRYAKVRGEVVIKASQEDWEDGAAGGSYRDYFQGPIHPDYQQSPLTFEAGDEHFPQFDQHSFDVSQYRAETTGVIWDQAAGNPGNPDAPGEPQLDVSGTYREQVPFGAQYPYDYYERPVFENMVFNNVRIPAGTNALFKNCVFKGITYIEVHKNNSKAQFPHPTDPDRNAFNYGGMQEADGTPKHPDIDEALAIYLPEGALSPKDLGNNLRFHNCRFEGSVVSGDQSGGQPLDYSHTRNKLTFTGETAFPDIMDPTAVPGLSDAERRLYRRSRLLVPHVSVEMGTFTDPYSSSETIHLSGAIVAGVLDMRGQVEIDGTILTTFEPTSDEGPVVGETSPNFNTTLGYFSNEDGDLEAGSLPDIGLGIIKIRYDPTLPLPDGVLAKVSIEPLTMTYHEGGAK